MHGFDPGPADGVFGVRTQAAVKAFQSARGVEVDGTVGSESFRALRREARPDSIQAADRSSLRASHRVRTRLSLSHGRDVEGCMAPAPGPRP